MASSQGQGDTAPATAASSMTPMTNNSTLAAAVGPEDRLMAGLETVPLDQQGVQPPCVAGLQTPATHAAQAVESIPPHQPVTVFASSSSNAGSPSVSPDLPPVLEASQLGQSAPPMGHGGSKPVAENTQPAGSIAPPRPAGSHASADDVIVAREPQQTSGFLSSGTNCDVPKSHCGNAEDLHIEHDYDDVDGHRILRLKPTHSQWQDFPAVLTYAKKLGADGDGCFKVSIPDVLNVPLPEKAAKKVPANAYKIKQIRKSTFWQVSTVPSEGEFTFSNPGPEFSESVDAALKHLKKLFRSNKDRQMRSVRYRVDVPAWTAAQRRLAGVPERSPIYPLEGDKLNDTKAIIPGIHTPYVYESGPHFGATFQMHAEDFRLASLNHLYMGRKIWIVVPATAVDVAEKALGRGEGCSQFMRHRAEFFFPDKLDKLGIPYRLVDQRPGETIVILPDAYHEGFSTGYTIAEAKNYADPRWNTDSYQPCQESCKLATAIPAAFMRPLTEGEERLDLCSAYGDDGLLKQLESLKKRAHGEAGGDGEVDVPRQEEAGPMDERDVKRIKV
ncbi:Lysine-specific demethylase 4D [Tolypocladium ophioglossoides CBS 100239]|uniref:Lysine-specific demethylase 4D n=1 Tax=Tolypocladium ophioglossoides (strain CBS 100239) TaxID=1163406 RepID=A0A0L0NAY4_TOLOC|nr:Lysine-specific demethylase 4D [Tolypocladium ophioglossoides CBS 100239]